MTGKLRQYFFKVYVLKKKTINVKNKALHFGLYFDFKSSNKSLFLIPNLFSVLKLFYFIFNCLNK